MKIEKIYKLNGTEEIAEMVFDETNKKLIIKNCKKPYIKAMSDLMESVLKEGNFGMKLNKEMLEVEGANDFLITALKQELFVYFGLMTK